MACLLLLNGCVTVEKLRTTRASIPEPPPADEGPEARERYNATLLARQESILKGIAPERKRVNPIVEGEQLITAAVYARQARQRAHDPAAYRVLRRRLLDTIDNPQPRDELEEENPSDTKRRLAAWAVFALGELRQEEDIPHLLTALGITKADDPSGTHRLHALHGLSQQIEALAAHPDLAQRSLVAADAAKRAAAASAFSAATGEEIQVLAGYLVDELKNLASVVALQRSYLDGSVAAESVPSILEWNHQLLAAIAAGQRARPQETVLNANRDTLLAIAAGTDAEPRRLARILLAASWPLTAGRWLCDRIIDDPRDPDDAVHLVNLLPIIDRALGHRPPGGGRGVDGEAITYDAPDSLPSADWPPMRTTALAAIDEVRGRLPVAECETICARLGGHDPLALATWLGVPSDPRWEGDRLVQAMRHRHRLLTMTVVERKPDTVAALEDAIATDIAIDHPQLRSLALHYLGQRAPQRLMTTALEALTGITEESPAGAAVLVDILIQSQTALEQQERSDTRIAETDALLLAGPLQRTERPLRRSWTAFLWDRRPSALLQAVVAQVTGRQDQLDLLLLGDLVARRAAWSAEDEQAALGALIHASRAKDEERQLLALRLLAEWQTGRARVALHDRLQEGDLPPAATTLVQLALTPQTAEEEQR